MKRGTESFPLNGLKDILPVTMYVGEKTNKMPFSAPAPLFFLWGC